MTGAQKNRAKLVATVIAGPVLLLIGILAIAWAAPAWPLSPARSDPPMSRPLLPARAPTHEVDP